MANDRTAGDHRAGRTAPRKEARRSQVAEAILLLVAVSGMLDVWDRDDLVDLGFVRVFAKPFDVDELVRACQGLCRRGAGIRAEGQPAQGGSAADA